MILVVGATGLLGRSICKRLRDSGREVRGLAREGSLRRAELEKMGVQVFTGDLRSPADVDNACRGVTSVISTATTMGNKDKSLKMRTVDRDGQLSLVAAAGRHNVRHFTFISASPNLTLRSPLIRYKRDVERALRASGMRWTILQPTVFMEVWLSPMLGWDVASARANVFGPGEAPLHWISVDDVARYAVASLDDARLHNQAVPLGGPRAISPNGVVQIFENLSSRKYTVKRVPRTMLVILGPVIGLFDENAASGMALGADTALGDPIDSPLQRELDFPLLTVEQYFARVSATPA